ncbi:MAG: LTA synthase family protein, partial [Xanthomonadales bacterium]|nr:LTA synthase family protein [Xanthomonadales bacterium]
MKNKINQKEERLALPVAIPVFAILIVCYRAYYIAQAIASDSIWREAGTLLMIGLLPVGVITLLCLIALGPNRSWFHKVLLLIAILSVCAIALDTFIIAELDNRLTLFNLVNYLPEWRSILHFAKPIHYFILVAIVVTSSIRISLSNRFRKFIFVCCFFMIAIGLGQTLSLETHLQNYSFLGKDFHEQSDFKAKIEYRPYLMEELHLYRKSSSLRESVTIPDGTKNIVLLIVESFSAADSFLISGLNDRVKRFDQISKDGTLFTNFYSNSHHTEAGMISILVGTPPLPFPGSSRRFSDSYRNLSSIPKFLKTKGYYTEFLTTGPLSFTNKGKFMRDIGFDVVEGREEVSRFRSAPRFAFDSPADGVLYDEAKERIKALLNSDSPFFLTLLTVSAHRPIMDPLGRENTQENLWDYVDREISLFYRSLRQTKFFDEGILIITGDHRKMFPLQENERLRYGKSADFRVPLLLIGNNVQAGRIDERLFQTSDIF